MNFGYSNGGKEKMRGRKAITVITLSLFLVSFISPLVSIRTQGSAHNTHITFSLDNSVASGSFSTDIYANPLDDIIKPGSTTKININVQPGPASLSVTVPSYGYGGYNFGGTYTINFETPLGALALPVAGNMAAGVYADLIGNLECMLSISGPGHLSSNKISWDTWGSKSIEVYADSSKDSGIISVSLKFGYSGKIGLHIHVEYLGDYQIVSPQTITLLDGSESLTLKIKVNTPPEVKILSLFNETVNGTIMISGTASDADGNGELTKVEIKVDNGYWQPVEGLTSWSYEWNTQTARNGEHIIYARAFDGTEYSSTYSMTLNVENEEGMDDENEYESQGKNNTIDYMLHSLIETAKDIFEDVVGNTKEKAKEMPGFEITSLACAIATLLVLRRRKND